MPDVSCDAVVIGAGVIGSAVTLELTRRGMAVITVDKLPAAGYGSTSSSAAIIRYHYSTRSGVALAWESMHWWRDWSDHVGDRSPAAEYVRMPMLMALEPGAPDPPYLGHFEDLGVPYDVVDIDEVDRRWPGFDWGVFGPACPLDDTDSAFWGEPSGRHTRAMISEDAGFITDPALAAQNLADAAVEEGATFRFRSEVVSIDRTEPGSGAERVAGVTLADGTRLRAPVVVNVGGPHSSVINAMAGVEADMERTGRALRREVYVAPAPMADFDSTGFLLGDLDVGVYFRPERGNNIIVGSTEPECDPLIWVDDPDSLDETLTEDDFQLHMLRIARRIPDFGIPRSKQGLVAMYDATEDWTPIYDRSNLDGYYMACGTSGNQFKNAPVSGWLMAELITAVEAGHDHDAEPLELTGPRTGLPIDLRTFSRRRKVDVNAGHTVLG